MEIINLKWLLICHVVAVYFIDLQTLAIVVKQCCANNTQAIICVETSGIFYTLGNGTWNMSSIKDDEQAFLSSLRSSTCPTTQSPEEPNCRNDCCYCDLEFPLPTHPITNGLLVPTGLTCERYLHKAQNHKVWHPVKSLFQLCESHGPVHVPFLCVLFDNLKQLERAYNRPKVLTRFDDKTRLKRPSFSWRNASNAVKNAGRKNAEQFEGVSNKSLDEEDVDNPFREVNDILYTITTDIEKGVDTVTIQYNPVNNQTFSFTASTECLTTHRKWDTFPPCRYSIDVSQVTDCTSLRVVVNVSSSVIYEQMTNWNENVFDEDSWDKNVESGSNRTRTGKVLTCDKFPIHLTASEVWAEGTHVATILGFHTVNSTSVGTELVITASVSQKVVTGKEYNKLSRFWASYYFGDCLYRQCWRDVWTIIPQDLIDGVTLLIGKDEGAENLFRWGFSMAILLICLLLVVRQVIFVYEDLDVA